MNKKLIISLVSGALLLFPMVILALTSPSLPTGGISSLWDVVTSILTLLWPIFFGIAIIMFVIAGFTFVIANGEPEKIKIARNAIIWGVVGVVVAVLAFSLPYIIKSTIEGPVATDPTSHCSDTAVGVCLPGAPGSGQTGCTSNADC